MTELTPNQKVQLAKQILTNELLAECIKELEDEYIGNWRVEQNSQKRTDLWYKQLVLADIKERINVRAERIIRESGTESGTESGEESGDEPAAG